MIRKRLPKERPIKEKYVLATVHRRESFGEDMLNIFQALKELSKTVKIILPAHPNPNVQKIIKEVGLEVVKPMNYVDFLWYLRDCEYVISDSGGIQEEAPSFGKKIIVLRKTTERQEVIESGYGILIKKMEKNYILKEIKKFSKKNVIINKNPFGDGHTSEKIINIINKYYV
jgi:UDP-N-acetylglucosamine 2-epimerase (non-hydrolysing)